MQPFCARARPRAAPARRTLLTHRASATRPPSRSGPCRAALVRSSPSPRTTAQATRRQEMSVRPARLALARGRAARTGPSARAWHSHFFAARPAQVAPVLGRRGACALRACARPQRLCACADGADHQPAVKMARPGVAVRAGSQEALSAPRGAARGPANGARLILTGAGFGP